MHTRKLAAGPFFLLAPTKPTNGNEKAAWRARSLLPLFAFLHPLSPFPLCFLGRFCTKCRGMARAGFDNSKPTFDDQSVCVDPGRDIWPVLIRNCEKHKEQGRGEAADLLS